MEDYGLGLEKITEQNNGNGTIVFHDAALKDGKNIFCVSGLTEDGIKMEEAICFEKVETGKPAKAAGRKAAAKKAKPAEKQQLEEKPLTLEEVRGMLAEKSDKEKSTKKIDGAVAAIIALDRAVRNGGSTGLLFMGWGYPLKMRTNRLLSNKTCIFLYPGRRNQAAGPSGCSAPGCKKS